jgi:hypothetical protein
MADARVATVSTNEGDMANGKRTHRDDEDRYWHRDRSGGHWVDRSTRWDRDEGYRPDERSWRDSSYPGGFEDRPLEGRLDEESYWRSSPELRGGYLGQGGQQLGYDRGGARERHDNTYGDRGTHRYGEHGYLGYPSQRGKGPVGYTRSDERIRELVCDALTDDHYVDATNIEVTVRSGEVILSGTVDDRLQKRMAETCVERIGGVKDVQNQLRIRA